MADSPINLPSAGSRATHDSGAVHDRTRESPAPGPSNVPVYPGARALAAPFAHIQHIEVPAPPPRPPLPFHLPEAPRQLPQPIPHRFPDHLAAFVPAPPVPGDAAVAIDQPIGPAPQPPPFRSMPLHGPLQAERLAQQTAAAVQRREKEEEKARKAAEKEAEKASKLAAKEQKEAQKRAKEAEKEATKKAKESALKGKGRPRGRRAAGNSDDEIADADPDQISSAGIKPIVKNEQSKKWSNEEGLRAVGHITHVWKRFKLKQADVSESVLLGSKTTTQVQHYWGNCWKKFKECRRREKHTGGGDGDELDVDATREEADSAEDTGSEEEKKSIDKKVTKHARGQFPPAQLDAFEQSEIYEMILKVANNNPEVIKAEEFDSARPLSDSDSDLPTKSRKKQLDDDGGDLELVRKTYDILSASLAGFAEARKANLELASRREAREEAVESDRREQQDTEQQLRKRRLEMDEEAHKATQERESQRMKLEMRRLQLEERDRHAREWEKVEELLRSDNRILVERGERMARRLQAEEDRMAEYM